MHNFITFIQNWNFVIPLLLWLAKEAYVGLKARSRRVYTWGIRRDRSVRLVIDQQRTGGNYLTGDLGPLAEARSAQKLIDNFRNIGLRPALLEVGQLEHGREGNLLIGGVLRHGDCLVRTSLARLGYTVTGNGEKYTIGGSEISIDLQLADSRLKIRAEHAIFAQGGNPDDPSHSLIVIAALTANGLEAAVDALIRRHHAVTVPRHGNEAGFIITTTVDTGNVEVEPLSKPIAAPPTFQR